MLRDLLTLKMEEKMEMKLLALASRLDCSPSQAAKKIEKKMYLVLTYEEATEEALNEFAEMNKEAIKAELATYGDSFDRCSAEHFLMKKFPYCYKVIYPLVRERFCN